MDSGQALAVWTTRHRGSLPPKPARPRETRVERRRFAFSFVIRLCITAFVYVYEKSLYIVSYLVFACRDLSGTV